MVAFSMTIPGPAMPDSPAGLSPSSVAVVIPAYTMQRWELIKRAVRSAQRQTYRPAEVVLCIDNNAELFRHASEEWRCQGSLDVPVRVMASRFEQGAEGTDVHRQAHGTIRRFGAGNARNSAVETISADVVAFLDDDAWAEPGWLEELVRAYSETRAVAVGGPPLPDYATKRPEWFPRNFDWVFGCAYEGLPTTTAPLAHLIGANMSVRRAALEAIAGFHSIDFDDLDMCMRLATKFGPGAVYFAPRAIVHHYVPADRVTWRYFYRRCFYVNREKVHAFKAMGKAANLASERDFVLRALSKQIRNELAPGRGTLGTRLCSIGAMLVGIGCAAAGNVRGRLDVTVSVSALRVRLSSIFWSRRRQRL